MTTKAQPEVQRVKHGAAARTQWAWIVSTFLGAGRLRPGPGTWASAAAAAIWYFGGRAAHLNGWILAVVSLAAALVVTLIGIRAASIVERESGSIDPGFVVIDEVAGQWVALAAAPLSPGHALVGLALFRVFDIVKPPPARQLERLHGGTGIMLDDLAAGMYAAVVMLVIRHWW